MRLPRTALAAAALAPALLLPATTAFAGTVTSLADDGGEGTLRSQIADADAGDVIVFQASLTGTIVLNSELVIQKNLTIDGPGARALRISGGDETRVLRVSEPTAEVEIEGVTIEHGEAGGMLPFGGGLLVETATRVRLERVSLVDNVADSDAGFPGFGAGAFVRDGEFELIDSTVARNRVLDDNGGGGGLFLAEVGTTFEIVGSTIAANEADLGAGVTAAGADGTIEDTTIARNVAELAGGIATSPTVPNVDIARSLVTANEATTGPACNGLVTSLGRNVVDNVTGCDFIAATGDATGVAAPVGTLGNNGGSTDTLMPLLGNPALDRVPLPCPGADQRGADRPRGPGCDAGAVEAVPAKLTAAGPLALGSALVGQQTAPASTIVTNTGEVAAVVTGVTLSRPERGRGRRGAGCRRVHRCARAGRGVPHAGAAGAHERGTEAGDLLGGAGGARNGCRPDGDRDRRPAACAARGVGSDGAGRRPGGPAVGAGHGRDHQRRATSTRPSRCRAERSATRLRSSQWRIPMRARRRRCSAPARAAS